MTRREPFFPSGAPQLTVKGCLRFSLSLHKYNRRGAMAHMCMRLPFIMASTRMGCDLLFGRSE